MRISTNAMNKLVTGSMSKSYDDYSKIIQKFASKKNFTKMSQNPVDGSKVLKLKDQLANLENYQSNIKAGMNEMNFAYDTLGEVNEELSNIKDRILEASNGSTSPSEAKAIAAEIEQRVASVVDKMNTKYLDNYIFSGTYTQDAPYAADKDGNIVYQGSSKKAGDRNLTVAENKVLTYNLTSEEIFGKIEVKADDKTEGEAEGEISGETDNKTEEKTDFFSQMKELDKLLKADTLDYDAIRSKLDVLDSTISNITSAQGMISSKVSALDKAYEDNFDTITKLTQDRSDLEDLDILKAASDLTSTQQALQASYAIGAQVLGSVSLLDYL